MTRRRALLWTAQGLLLAAVTWFAADALGRHWHELTTSAVSLMVSPAWLACAAALVLLSYAMLIAAWRSVLAGWGAPLSAGQAMRIWTLSNLGRYLPGKVWAVAGLAVLAQRAGVPAWAAVGSALVVQALAIGSGVAVVLATVPGTAAPGWLGLAAVIAIGTVAAFTSRRGLALIARAVPRATLAPLGGGAVLRATAVAIGSWIAYGVALWALARGLFAGTALRPGTAVGIFAAAYIAGLLAVFAPGGVVVREGVLAGALTPVLGPGPALALSLASRVLLTVTELLAALAGLLIRPARLREDAGAD